MLRQSTESILEIETNVLCVKKLAIKILIIAESDVMIASHSTATAAAGTQDLNKKQK